MSSVTTTLVVTVVSCIVNFSAIISPPTYKFPPIPTPPATVKAPVVVEDELLISLISTTPNVLVPVTPNVPEATTLLPDMPLTYKFPLIPTPPATINAPVLVDVEFVAD